MNIEELFNSAKIVEIDEASKNKSATLLKLTSRERFVLMHRFELSGADKKTIHELSKEFGVTIDRIKQHETNALSRIALLFIRSNSTMNINQKEIL
jgi:DNA-directed RNA polymerase sigma subunit (sigma70/sigma32)